MASGVVGSVSISVLPDLSKFNRQLRTYLESKETYYRRNPAEIRALIVPKLDKSELTKQKENAERALSRLNATISDVTADRESIHHAKKKIEHDLDNLHAEVNTDADTLAARTKLAWLTRPRRVHIGTVFEDTGKVAQALAAFSGVRSLDKTTSMLRNLAMNIDTVAVKAAAAYGALGALSGIAAGGTAGIINFGAGLTKAAKSAIILPAALSSAAAATTAFILGIKDAKNILGDLKHEFTSMQDKISAAFWTQAEQPLRHLASTTLPLITTKMTELGTATGTVTAAIADAIRQSATVGHMTQLFDNTHHAVTLSAQGARDMTAAIGQLGAVGSENLPRLAQWLNDCAARFKNFVNKAANNGDVQKWADQGVQGLKDLGNVVKNLATIWTGLYKATSTAGVGMAGLVEQTKAFSDTVNKPAFQTKLSTILDGARKGANGLKDGIRDLGAALGDIAPLVSHMLETTGVQIGKFATAIANVLHAQEIRAGLADLNAGFVDFTNAVASTLTSIAPTLGVFLSALGKVASTVGAVLGGALATVSPLLTGFLRVVSAIPSPILAGAAAFLALNKGLVPVVKTIPLVNTALDTFRVKLKLANMSGLSGQVAASAAAFGTFRTMVSAAGMALKAAFMSNAPMLAITAITTAIGFFVGKLHETKQHEEDLAATLDQTTGALTEQTAAFYASDKDLTAAAQKYGELGGNVEDFYGALMGNKDALERVNALLGQHTQKVTATSGVLGEAAQTQTKYTDGADKVANAIAKTTAEQQKAQNSVRATAAAQEKANRSLEEANKAFTDHVALIGDVIKAQKKLAGEALSVAEAQSTFAQALDSARRAAGDTSNVWDDTLNTWNALSDSGKAMTDSSKQLTESLFDTAEAMNEQGASTEKIQAKLQQMIDDWYATGEAAGVSRDTMEEFVRQANLVPEHIATSVTADTQTAIYEINDFVAEVDGKTGTITIGGNPTPGKTTLGELIGDVNEADGTVTINGNKFPADMTLTQFINDANKAVGISHIHAESSNAEAEKKAFENHVHSSTPTMQIKADGSEVDRYARQKDGSILGTMFMRVKNLLTNSEGGMYPQMFANGGVKFFARGAENHVAQIAPAGSYRVWAENETGGEAYIPLSPHKRTRSLQILRNVADRFGYGLSEYADGSDATGTRSGGSATYNIHVNVDAQDLRDLSTIAQFVDMIGVRVRQGVGSVHASGRL